MWKIIILAVLAVVLASGCVAPGVSDGGKECSADSDCVVFGESGECNCGCYARDNLPSSSGGACFCAAPTSCLCVEGQCEGAFGDITNFKECAAAGNPVMESYPRQCRTPDGQLFVEKLEESVLP